MTISVFESLAELVDFLTLEEDPSATATRPAAFTNPSGGDSLNSIINDSSDREQQRWLNTGPADVCRQVKTVDALELNHFGVEEWLIVRIGLLTGIFPSRIYLPRSQ